MKKIMSAAVFFVSVNFLVPADKNSAPTQATQMSKITTGEDAKAQLETFKKKEAKRKKKDKYKIHVGAAHGYAFLERIRNLTDFPASVFYKKTIHDQLPADSVVRIKSFKEDYGPKGRYYAARLVGGGWRLRADTDDPDDPATQFITHRYVSRDLTDWLGFTSAAAGKDYLGALPSNAVQFAVDDFADEMKVSAHWQIIGSNLRRCVVKNRMTKGFLSCRSKEDEAEVGKYVPPPPVVWKWWYKTSRSWGAAGFKKRTQDVRFKDKTLGKSDVLKLSTASDGLVEKSRYLYKRRIHITREAQIFGSWDDGALADADEWHTIRDEKNPYALREMVAFINKTRHHITAGGDVKVAMDTIKRFAREAEAAREREAGYKKELHYGDKVRIVHHDTWQQLYADSKNIFCANEDSTNEYDGEKNSWWIIKGPHRKGDPWNCEIGKPVKNGDIIRLEHEKTKKNLRCLRGKKAEKAKTVWGKRADDGREYKVALAGEKGIGKSDDNWIINFEKDADALYNAASFYLTNRNTGFSLRSHNELLSKSPNKQRVTGFQKKKPSCKWFVNGVSYGQIPVVDIAWTGFPNGSPAIDETSKEAIGFEIIKLGMGGGIKPNTTLDFYMPLEGKTPKVAGFAKEEIPGFGPGYLVRLSPLVSKGVAWLEQSLEKEGKATVAFLTRVSDKGDAQVIFGNNISLDFTWKIILGSGRNTSSKVIKRTMVGGKTVEEVVAEVKKSDNPLAAPTAGTYVPYWVSIDDGLILVGASTTPGENIFMAWRDPDPRNVVSRIGFGTHDGFIEYTGIEIRDPVVLQKPEKTYAKMGSQVSVSSPDPKWLSTPLRVPGRGTFEFSVEGDKKASVYVSEGKSPRKKHYKLTITSGEDEDCLLQKWDLSRNQYVDLVNASKQYREKNKLLSDDAKKFWISFAKGRIFVGSGEIGENLFLYHWDMQPYENILNVGISSGQEGKATFSNISIYPPVDVSVAKKVETYVQEQDLFKFRGSLHVISPYEYELSQEGQSVKFEDKINHKTYYPGKTPQQDAKYYFMLMLHRDGFPELIWVREPENPQKLSLEKHAMIQRAYSDTYFQASTWVQGMGVLGGLAGVAASIVYAEEGINLGETASRAEAGAALNFRSHDSYVYTDQAVAQQLAQAHIPEEARANQVKATEKIELGGKWTPSTLDKLERLIPLYQQVINLINHPYVVRDQYIKKSLFDAIATLYESHQEIHANPQAPIDLTYSGMINLLLSAYNNPYLIDLNRKKEIKLKEVWYSQINELARQILLKDPETHIALQPSYGEYIWLNDQFEKPGSGSVSFEVKGANDVFVGFAPMPLRVRNTDNDIYETVFGGWDNEKSVIRVRSLDKSVVETMNKKLKINPIKYQRYWVSVSNGKIDLGTGELDPKNIVYSWKDPYPLKDVQYIGISNWNATVNFKNIQVGPAVGDVEDYKKKIIAQIMELRRKQEAAMGPETPSEGEVEEKKEEIKAEPKTEVAETPVEKIETKVEAKEKKVKEEPTTTLLPTEPVGEFEFAKEGEVIPFFPEPEDLAKETLEIPETGVAPEPSPEPEPVPEPKPVVEPKAEEPVEKPAVPTRRVGRYYR
ncbi:hypothetical protein ACFLY6_00830 [Candidatus Dependentiae bacterium]